MLYEFNDVKLYHGIKFRFFTEMIMLHLFLKFLNFSASSDGQQCKMGVGFVTKEEKLLGQS